MATFQPEPRIASLNHIVELLRTTATRAPAHQQLFGQSVRLAAGTEALVRLASTRDPTITDGAHVKRVATAAAQLRKEATAALDRMNAAVQSGMDEIAKSRNTKVRLIPDPAYASEVRAHYRSLDHVKQFALLGELVDGNRGPELAAIVKAPASLTGITPDIAQRFTTAIHEKHSPQEMEAEAALMKAFEAALTALTPAREVVEAYSDPVRMAEITKAEEAASAAAAQFKSALP